MVALAEGVEAAYSRVCSGVEGACIVPRPNAPAVSTKICPPGDTTAGGKPKLSLGWDSAPGGVWSGLVMSGVKADREDEGSRTYGTANVGTEPEGSESPGAEWAEDRRKFRLFRPALLGT